MSKIFLSHSSTNNGEALAVAQWLEANGWSEYFLDISPERGISTGQRWQEALKTAAHRCEAVIFLISRSWLDSKWSLAEFLLAKNLGKNIFGVLIEDIALNELPNEMTSEYQLCDLVTGVQRETFTVECDPFVPVTEINLAGAGLEKLRIGLQYAGLDASAFPWPPKNDPERSPYRGLKPLQLEDAAVYFGHDARIVRGLDELRKLRETRAATIMVVLGASGCGKSSFLRAGLWPRLRRDGRHFIPLPVVRPARGVVCGDHGLAGTLKSAFGEFGVSKTRGEIQATTREIGGIDKLLLELRAAATTGRETSERPPSFVLGLDQGEELYMGEGAEESQQMRRWLAAIMEKNDRSNTDTAHVIPVITIRTDLYEPLQTDEILVNIEQRIFGLKPIDRTEYREIIEGPAERASEAGHLLNIDQKLTERLLEDTEGADALPLLAFTLERLFIDWGSDGDLRLDEYETAGGVQGALEAAIDAALEAPQDFPVIPASRGDQEKLLRAAFVPWLAEIDEQTGERRRRQADWEEIPIETHSIVERLVKARLLLRDQAVSGKMIIEVTHEALLRRWPALVRWLDADADILRATAAVVRSAGAWNGNDRNSAWLDHSGERLTEAESILQRLDLHRRLGTDGRDYLAECRRSENEFAEKERQQHSRIAEEQQKTRRYQKHVGFGLVFVGLLLSAFAFWTYQRTLFTSESVSRVLKANSQKAYANGFFDRAMRLGILAAKDDWKTRSVPGVSGTLGTAVQRLRLRQVFHKKSAISYSATFSADGRRVVTASRGGTARVWDAESGAPVGEPVALEDSISHAAFSADGRQFMATSVGGTVRIWNTESGALVGKPLAHEEGVNYASFSADGRRVVTVGRDRKARVWNAESSEQMGVPLAHKEWINYASFSTDGRRVVTASNDGTARVWDAESGALVGKPLAHEEGVNYASFSTDGRRVVTTSEDDAVRVWDAESGAPVGEPLRHEDTVNHAAFSTNGQRVVTASEDRTARVWDAESGASVGEPLKHKDAVNHAAFSTDGRHIMTASDDHTARAWDAESGTQVGELLRHEDFVNYAAFSADGRRIVTVSGYGTAQVWDVESSGSVGKPLTHEYGVNYAEFSTDGRLVVTASGFDTVRLWDADSGVPAGEPLDVGDSVNYATLSADGRRIVTVYEDGPMRLWDAESGAPVGEPLADEEWVYYAAFSLDSRRFVTASLEGTVRLWDAESGAPVGEPLAGEVEVNDAAFSADGRLVVTACEDGTARLWDAESGAPVGAPLVHEGAVYLAAFSADTRWVVTASEGHTVRVWDVESGSSVGAVLAQEQRVDLAALSVDGRRVVTVGRDATRLWDTESGALVGEPLAHKDKVNHATFSENGRRVLTASDDGTARLWDAENGEPVGEPLADKEIVTHAAFSADGRRVVTASDDGTAQVWAVDWLTQDGPQLIHAICNSLSPSITILTEHDLRAEAAPILAGRAGEDVCSRYR